jgi:hypothetical protein
LGRVEIVVIAILKKEKKSHTNGCVLRIGVAGNVLATRIRDGGGTEFLIKFPGVAWPIQCQEEEIEWRKK